MIFKLKTSKKTLDIFDTIQRGQSLAPYVLSKLAIALSLKTGQPIKEAEFNTDNLGMELNRQTITGENDILFKSLIMLNENKHIEDEEYFPKYVKAHLDRGALLLEAEYRYSNDFITHLANLDKSI